MVAISYTFLALAALSAVSAGVVPNHLARHALISRKSKPATYDESYLEKYTTYHTRYLALDCEDKHGTQFFKQCCHPLLATEKLETARAPQCIPSDGSSSSAAQSEPTSNVKTPPPPKPKGASPNGSEKKSKSSSAKVAPASTPKPKAPKPNSQPSGGDVHTGGFGTFFFQNGVAGACGTVHKDSDFVVALDTAIYGNTGVKSPHCGHEIHITNTKNNKSIKAIVADACPTCDNANSVDMSKAAFSAIADLSTGLIPITWTLS